jgi:hypothetical protein
VRKRRALLLVLLPAALPALPLAAAVSEPEARGGALDDKVRGDAANRITPAQLAEAEARPRAARELADRVHALPPHLVKAWAAGEIDATSLDEPPRPAEGQERVPAASAGREAGGGATARMIAVPLLLLALLSAACVSRRGRRRQRPASS